MLNADLLNETHALIEEKWVVARPMAGTLISRIRDAIQVLKGNADAVKFYKQ